MAANQTLILAAFIVWSTHVMLLTLVHYNTRNNRHHNHGIPEELVNQSETPRNLRTAIALSTLNPENLGHSFGSIGESHLVSQERDNGPPYSVTSSIPIGHLCRGRLYLVSLYSWSRLSFFSPPKPTPRTLSLTI